MPGRHRSGHLFRFQASHVFERNDDGGVVIEHEVGEFGFQTKNDVATLRPSVDLVNTAVHLAESPRDRDELTKHRLIPPSHRPLPHPDRSASQPPHKAGPVASHALSRAAADRLDRGKELVEVVDRLANQFADVFDGSDALSLHDLIYREIAIPLDSPFKNLTEIVRDLSPAFQVRSSRSPERPVTR